MVNPFKKSNTPSWLKEFNTDKQKAISAPLGPTAVIAGAGTGKTTTLIHRIIYLIEVCGVDPEKILILTFTKKAAKEIQERIDDAVTKFQTTSACAAGTFHSFCNNALGEVVEEVGYKNHFTVITDRKNNFLWKEALLNTLPNYEKDMEDDKFVDFDWEAKPNNNSKKLNCELVTNILTHFQRIKESEGLDKAGLWFNDFIQLCQPKVTLQQCKSLLKEFAALKKSHNVVHFDDLLNLFNKALDNKEVRDRWNERIDAIVVDEFQDIDPVQFDIICKLSEQKRNVFVVGDPDQAIYGFRGTKPKIFEEFIDKFQPDCEVYKLEENFRSTNQILKYANDLINVNTRLDLKKNLFSHKPDKEQPTCMLFTDCNDEPHWIEKKIKELAKTIPLSEMAIIYRCSYFGYRIQSTLTQSRVPFTVSENKKLFEKEAIRNVLDYLRLVFSDDSLALEAVINYPKRGIGPSCVDKIKEFKNTNNITFFEAVQKYQEIDSLTTNNKTALSSVVNSLEQLRLLKDDKSLHDAESDDFNLGLLFKKIFAITCIEQAWNESPEKDNKIIRHFYQAQLIILTALIERKEKLENFLNTLELYVTEQDEEKPGINLLTIHKAKGLEFKVVFIIQALNKNYPLLRSVNDDAPFLPNPEEEERRIFYVAATRAKEHLFITACVPPTWDFKNKLTPYVEEHKEFVHIQRQNTKARTTSSVFKKFW